MRSTVRQAPAGRLILLSFALCAMMFVVRAGAEELAASGLSHFVLANGLEVFVDENHVVPLAKIQITFRCGSITQTPQTAGLFHLYEHMLFKGNRVYRSESEFQSAMKEIGVAGWNGGTTNEHVSYYFTVPSSKVDLGIAFWANAVRYPLFDEAELATEKQVVINEIRGYLNNPGDIFVAGINRRLYFEYPWRRDVSGSEANIANASVEMMRQIQHDYYIPNNAALFVGGDVNPGQIRQLAERYFGSWRRGEDPWRTPLPPHPAPPKDSLFVFSDEQIYPGVAQVTIRFRGPDVLRDSDATYAADVWGKFMDDPNGQFRIDMMKEVPGLYNKDYLWGFYYTQRDGGYVDFTTLLRLDSESSIYARVKGFLAALRREITRMTEDPGYFPAKDFGVLKVMLGDEKLLEQETASRFISSLSFWWASADTAYYFGYLDSLNKVGPADLTHFLRTYLVGANAVVGLLVNPRDADAEKAQAEGFDLLDRTNAFWWSEGKEEGRQ